MEDTEETGGKDFIRQIVASDIAAGKYSGGPVTRFPPEPNGYLHIGHAKSICLNFGVAREFSGACYLRFDDTNPEKESQDFVDSIQQDVRWLGFNWGDKLAHASDYFQKIYECAERLIQDGKAYVDSLSAEEIRAYRGTLTEPGRNSPWRNRTNEESLDLFRRMRSGEFPDGAHVLRARIDMASANINLRDPALYRIRHAHHQRTGERWCIYPMYDFAHTVSDALEGTTHSLCTLEFEDHRPLYDWILDQLRFSHRPRQYEFSRLNLAFTVTSKRKLAELIRLGCVSGWDDPRMPTIAGMRRRGYSATAIRDFCARIGVTRKENLIEMGVLENCVREDFDATTPRAMAVLDPLKVVLINYPEGQKEEMTAANHPNIPDMGERQVLFTRELYIERDDFMEDPLKKFFRLRPGGEVRLRYGYIIQCVDVVKNAAGDITEVHCTFDPDTRSGEGAQRKVKGTIHWVSAATAVPAEVRLYDRLFSTARPEATGDGADYKDNLNPDSLKKVRALLEPSLAGAAAGQCFQFERLGYFVADAVESRAGSLVFNRIVTLRDSWAKIENDAIASFRG